MIKIRLNDEQRRDVEQLYLEDAMYANTGIGQLLKRRSVSSAMKREHSFLYNLLYDESGNVDEIELKRLLLADRTQMRMYIDCLPDYNETQSKSLLQLCFRYDTWAKRQVAYKIVDILHLKVCPYCDRQYITGIKEHHIRPQFDHYFPKSIYPYLALTLWNLVPCCSNCNTAKSDMDTVKNPILYPYEEEFGERIVFKRVMNENANFTQFVRGLSNDFQIKACDKENQMPLAVSNQVKQLHIEALYNEHMEDVNRIIKNQYINPESRIEELYQKYRGILFESKEEIQQVIYMADLRKEMWGDTPLTKLKRDIYNEELKKNKRRR